MSKLEDRVTETLREYKEAWGKADEVRSQYIATGSIGPGEKIRWPPKVLDTKGLQEIEEADRIVNEKWDAHQAAIDAWRRQA